MDLIINQQLRNELIRYLGTRPHDEVFIAIDALKRLEQFDKNKKENIHGGDEK